ncbi:19050_t:CDS:2 [Cetraspora pellucida]|uniref:19050_t:CDS:1 n=1 Tax=Cetraspora pellucida TaxID=1433469 RepID=A0A9N9DRY3_9GLOM|nr:19050_t:CDS:2 [Cetraspora pellucida]
MLYAAPKVLSDKKQFTQVADIYGINGMWWSVALKVIHNSNRNEQGFIQELKNYCEIGYKNPLFLDCIGASKNNYSNYMQIAVKSSLWQNLVQV